MKRLAGALCLLGPLALLSACGGMLGGGAPPPERDIVWCPSLNLYVPEEECPDYFEGMEIFDSPQIVRVFNEILSGDPGRIIISRGGVFPISVNPGQGQHSLAFLKPDGSRWPPGQLRNHTLVVSVENERIVSWSGAGSSLGGQFRAVAAGTTRVAISLRLRSPDRLLYDTGMIIPVIVTP